MSQSLFVEALEGRWFLSAAPMVAEVAGGRPLAVTVAAAAGPVVAKGACFAGTATLGELTGKLVLTIKTVSGTAVTGVLASGGWGGFSVPVSGTIGANRAVSLAGNAATCRVKSMTGTLSANGKTLTGNVTVVQMGLILKGAVTAAKTAQPPSVQAPAVPSLLGTYRGTTSNDDAVHFVFTKQQGGLLWGRDYSDGSSRAATGIEYAAGKFRFVINGTDGYTLVNGQSQPDGSLGGEFASYGNGGSRDSGTFSIHKV